MSYCKVIKNMSDPVRRKLHQDYHDKAYGFPIHDDNELFCRLVLEINQAGLSWETILKKQDMFRKAYSNFDLKKVAKYTAKDRARLLKDPGIIRNRLNVNAAIENAKRILELQKEHGSFKKWIEINHPLNKGEWVKLFKKNFKFTGGEIVNEFLMSTGVLPCPHDESCAVYKRILKAKPLWSVSKKK